MYKISNKRQTIGVGVCVCVCMGEEARTMRQSSGCDHVMVRGQESDHVLNKSQSASQNNAIVESKWRPEPCVSRKSSKQWQTCCP